MRAFVLHGPRRGSVDDVPVPVAEAGQVVVQVERAGVCGTDVELFTGEMSYLHNGQAAYPLRPGHEWSGVVSAVGSIADEAWLGRRVCGDTMLGCGVCSRCRDGRHHVCAERHEVGIRRGWPGALAEQLAVPVSSLRVLPETVGAAAGALVEPGGNALRAVRAAGVDTGRRVLVIGPGTIGLLTALFAVAAGAEVAVAGVSEDSLEFARALGIRDVWPIDRLPDTRYDAVVDASNGPGVPALAVSLVEPGGRIVLIGIAPEASFIDTRALVLADVTAVGVLSGSGGLDGAIEEYACGHVDPVPLVGATVGLDRVADVLAGRRPDGSGAGPKIQIDPQL